MATAEVDRSRRTRALSPLRSGSQSPRLASSDDRTGGKDSWGTKESLESYYYRMWMEVWGRSAASPRVSDEPSLSTAMVAVAEDSQLSQAPEIPSEGPTFNSSGICFTPSTSPALPSEMSRASMVKLIPDCVRSESADIIFLASVTSGESAGIVPPPEALLPGDNDDEDVRERAEGRGVCLEYDAYSSHGIETPCNLLTGSAGLEQEKRCCSPGEVEPLCPTDHLIYLRSRAFCPSDSFDHGR